MILERYTLEIVSDDSITKAREIDRWARSDERVRADLPALLEEVEENLTSLLPEGYQAQIGGKQ